MKKATRNALIICVPATILSAIFMPEATKFFFGLVAAAILTAWVLEKR